MEGIDFSVPVEELQPEAVDREISEIRSSKEYRGEGPMLPRDREKYLSRMEALYQRKFAPPSKEKIAEKVDAIKQEGEQAQEAWEEENIDEPAIREVEFFLRDQWGGDYETNMAQVFYVFDHFISEEDRDAIVNAGLGNDKQLIQAFQIIASKLDPVFKWESKSYKRKE